MFEPGEVKTFNPAKEISKEITLEILIRHRDALKQARNGELVGVTMDKIDDNARKLNQVKALNLIVSAQREMVTISRPIIWFRATQKWKKTQKTEEDQKEKPFDKDENDYNRLIEWLNFLRDCEKAILNAERTKSRDDDFMVVRQKTDGDVNELTPNFYDMVDDLESSYEQIYLLMLTNKIVSAGIEEDEYLTHEELAEEARKRIIDS